MIDLNRTRIDELVALLAVAQEKTFSAAGKRLQRHPSIISKRIYALETRLSVRLIERTTRQVRLTLVGERLAASVKSASDGLLQAEFEASADVSKVQGHLRLTFPSAMGRLWLAPLVPEFLNQYPGLTVEINYSDNYIDLVGEGIDAAIRIGVLHDNRLIAKKLSPHFRILGASEQYLKEYGMPFSPQDLTHHNCLMFSSFNSFPVWKLTNGKNTESVSIHGSLSSNDSLSLLEAARQGIGILGAGSWLMAKDFKQQSLVPVLPEWSFDSTGGIFLVRPSAKFTPIRTQVFMEWIGDKFMKQFPWDSL